MPDFVQRESFSKHKLFDEMELDEVMGQIVAGPKLLKHVETFQNELHHRELQQYDFSNHQVFAADREILETLPTTIEHLRRIFHYII